LLNKAVQVSVPEKPRYLNQTT